MKFLKENKLMIIAAVLIVVIIILYFSRKEKPIANGTLSSGYGDRINPITGAGQFHNGIDISAKAGTPIKSVLPGTVELAGYDSANGNYVKIKHRNFSTFFGHMIETPKVKVGQKVVKGQIIGNVGSTGWSTGPHTHFIVYNKAGQTINPLTSNIFRV
jgi:murein DD-endopeptidase MepM/ murein hydrolase activator NlpD